MYRMLGFLIIFSLLPVTTSANKKTTASIIAREPVTMMDLGILKLNSVLSNANYAGLGGAKIGANYNARKGKIEIKVSHPVKKASRQSCAKTIKDTKKIFLHSQPGTKKKVSNIHHYFQHEGTAFRQRINWNDLANHVTITGIVITKSNYQESIYCQSNLMGNKITY